MSSSPSVLSDSLPDEKKKPFAVLDTPIKIDLGDGIERDLVFNIGVFKKLKKRLGRPIISRNGGLLDLDEELLPELILAGLCNEDGDPPEGVTLATIDRLPGSALPYLVEKFSQAFLQFLPPLKKETAAKIAAANR